MHSRSKRHSLCVEQLESRALLSIALPLTPQQTAVDAIVAAARHQLPPPPLPSTTPLPSPIAGTNYKLIFDDEFAGTKLDTSEWNTVGPWGHPVSSTLAGETYSAANVTQDNGLTITAERTGNTWTTGIISTNGLEQWRYGFFDIRAKMPPEAAGFWPAIWMSGSNSSTYELDIAEAWGNDPGVIAQTTHTSAGQYIGQQQVQTTGTTWSSEYHDYEMLWQPGRVTFYIDNVETASFTGDISNEFMYLMINFDVGGPNDFSGPANASTPSPAQFDIQYVRVYQD